MHQSVENNCLNEKDQVQKAQKEETKLDVVSNILDILQAQKNKDTGTLETSERVVKAKEKIIKQLPNMYKNTRMVKYLIQNNPSPCKIEYKKIKGLMLNIAKRFSWYLDLEEENTRCLLISTKAKSYKDDITEEDRKKGFFEYYAKTIFPTKNGEIKFIVVPLYNLNISVI